MQDFVESDKGASPIKPDETNKKLSDTKMTEEESADEHIDSKRSKRDSSESRHSDKSSKSDVKERSSKSLSKEKEEESPKKLSKSSEKQPGGPTSSERLKVAQRLMAKVREAGLELYHDEDFRTLIEDFIRPPKTEPDISQKKRAKKRSYASESDGSTGRSAKEQPKKKMNGKK